MTGMGLLWELGSLYFLPWKGNKKIRTLTQYDNKNTQTYHLAQDKHPKACDLLSTHPGNPVAFNSVCNESFTPSGKAGTVCIVNNFTEKVLLGVMCGTYPPIFILTLCAAVVMSRPNLSQKTPQLPFKGDTS